MRRADRSVREILPSVACLIVYDLEETMAHKGLLRQEGGGKFTGQGPNDIKMKTEILKGYFSGPLPYK